MSTFDLVVLCLAAAAGGGINAVAGGGTLLTFPALHALLGPLQGVMANQTSTVALFPGSLTAVWAYRSELQHDRAWVNRLAVPSLMGGIIGALLLNYLPKETFEAAVPWLILTAAVLFSLQPRIARWTGIGQEHAPPSAAARAGVLIFQLLVGIYGGYFGAGIGILMLAALALMGLSDIHAMNAVKTALATLINGVAVIIFIVAGSVHWPLAGMMAIAGAIGGYTAARVARRLDRRLVRGFVISVGYVLAAYYFYRRWQG